MLVLSIMFLLTGAIFCRYVKLKHLHCMCFRKCFSEIQVKDSQTLKDISNHMFTPQDQETGDKETTSELPNITNTTLPLTESEVLEDFNNLPNDF